MRKLILLLVLIIISCKNVNENTDYVNETIPFINDKVKDDIAFDKVTFYKEYIRNEFMQVIEQNKLYQKHPELIDSSSLSIEIGASLKLKELQIQLIVERPEQPINKLHDLNYEYLYNYTQIYIDTLDHKEVKYSGVLAIDEGYKVIDGDSIPTVRIIW